MKRCQLQLLCAVACFAVLVIACHACGQSSARTQNFIVSSVNDGRAAEYAETAEKWYSRLAEDWYSEQLPPLSQPAQINITANSSHGGGATSYVIIGRRVDQVTGTWQGKPERLLDAVIPHEVFHIVNANWYGTYLPRWIDEGICTTVESREGKKVCYSDPLYQYLSSGRGIPFNQMLTAKEYPRDVMAFYAQSWSATEFLLRHGGKPQLVKFVETGCKNDDWHGALKSVYGFDANEFQQDWNDWAAQGMPEPSERITVNKWSRESKRWGVCESCGDGGATVGGVLIGRVRVPQPPQEQSAARPIRDPELKAWLTEVRDQLVDVKTRLETIKSCECECASPPTAKEVAAELQCTMPTAEQIADALFEKYGDKLKGEQGPPGADGHDGSDGQSPDTPEAYRHFVVVGDPSASYARKLKADVEKTATYFSAIKLVASPTSKYVGTLPAIVLYVGSQEAVTYRGTSDVYLQLSRIRRGEFQ